MMREPAIQNMERFTCSGGELAYRDVASGRDDGPALVLLHGFPTSSYLWREFIPLLSGRFRVIAPDLMGWGDSVAAATSSLDIAAQAGYVGELVTHLGIERFAVVGHGAGGGVAQLMALDGEGVDAMILLDAIAFDGWPSGSIRETQARLAESQGPPDPDLVDAVVRTAFEVGTKRRGRPSEGDLEEFVRPWRTGDGPARFARAINGLDGRGLTGRDEDLSRIAFPVLILWGEEDPFLPAALGERLNEAMPSSTLGLLPGVGHYLTEEVPETIGPMIAEYLRARFLMESHGHDQKEGVVMLQLERRPPWVDLAEDEADDWFTVEDEEG